MLVPIGAAGARRAFAGQLFHAIFVGPSRRRRSGTAASPSTSILPHAMHEVPVWVKYTPTAVMLVGLAIA